MIDNVQKGFRDVGSIIIRLRWWIILILIVTDFVAILGIPKIQLDVSSENWFLEEDPLTIATNEFESQFGNNDYVGILVEADDVFAPDILRMIRELGEELEEKVPFAGEVTSLTDIEFTLGTEDGVEIRDIVPDEIPTSPEEIEAIRQLAFSKEFLVNRLFSDDSTQIWIMLRLESYPDEWEDQDYPPMFVGKTVLDLIAQPKYDPYTIKIAGTPSLYEEREFFSQEALRTMKLAIVIGVLVLFMFLRSLRGIVIPMITAISSVLWIFGTMGHLGTRIDTIVMTLPIYLGMAVSIGYSIHIFNFFQRHFLTTGNRKEAVLYAVQETGWPILFTAFTTISALSAFYFVPINVIRWMGLSSALVVLTTYILVMTLTPTLLSFGKEGSPQSDDSSEELTHVIMTGKHHKWLEDGFTWFSSWLLDHSRPVMVVFILLVIFFSGGLTQVYVSMNQEKTYGLAIPYVARLHYIARTKIGATNSYNVTLTFSESNRAKDPEILKNFELLISEVEQFPLVKRVSSLLDVIKDMNQVMHSDAPNYYRIPDERDLVSQLLLLYEMSGGTEQAHWVDYEYTTLRLMVEVGDFDTAEVEKEFEYLQQRTRELFPDAEFSMVGGLVQFSVVQNYIVKGEIVSSFLALVVVCILMILVFRSVKTGLIAMIPNLAPVFVIGGIMGYADIPLDMTTMMIVPMLIGLAVDDTIHFITHSKLEFDRTGNYRRSIQATFHTVGKAIFMTSFILVATFFVYVTSIANFFFHIGILAIAGVLSALFADYFITPILVYWSKPFGAEIEKEE